MKRARLRVHRRVHLAQKRHSLPLVRLQRARPRHAHGIHPRRRAARLARKPPRLEVVVPSRALEKAQRPLAVVAQRVVVVVVHGARVARRRAPSRRALSRGVASPPPVASGGRASVDARRGARRDARRARRTRVYFPRAASRAEPRARRRGRRARRGSNPSSVGAAEPRAGLDWIRARRSFARAMSTSPRGASQRAETSGGARRRAIADATTTRGRRIGTIRRGRAI